MGIDHVLFDRLGTLSARFRPEGRLIMPGRHEFPIQMTDRKLSEKTAEPVLADIALQSDCETRWNGAANAGMTRLDGETQERGRRVVDAGATTIARS